MSLCDLAGDLSRLCYLSVRDSITASNVLLHSIKKYNGKNYLNS